MKARGSFAIAGIRLTFAVLLIASCSGQADAQVPSSTFGSPVVVGTSRQTNTAGTSLDLGSNTNSMLLPVGTTGQEPSPATAGMIRWNSTTLQVEAYNATAWTALVQSQTTPVVTASAGSGYFVMSGTTWNGAPGSRAAADALCLTELTSTYTGWQGYSTANSRGQLIASKVHAFICDVGACNSLVPLTTYYFASAANSSAGGAWFTTDSSGNGPQDSAPWTAANYFSGTYNYWTNRNPGTNTLWPSTSSSNNCSGLTNASGTGITATSGSTTSSRWGIVNAFSCSTSLNYICFVNP
jgi:hypothetical protein